MLVSFGATTTGVVGGVVGGGVDVVEALASTRSTLLAAYVTDDCSVPRFAPPDRVAAVPENFPLTPFAAETIVYCVAV
jgi:hypothetical protein